MTSSIHKETVMRQTGTEAFTTEGAKRTWQSKFTVNVMLFM